MSSSKQTNAARRNVRKAAAAAKRKRTLSKLPKVLGVDKSTGSRACLDRSRGTFIQVDCV